MIQKPLMERILLMNTKVLINRLPTGVPGLDDILGMRGLPELSFNLIGGIPRKRENYPRPPDYVLAGATRSTSAFFYCTWRTGIKNAALSAAILFF